MTNHKRCMGACTQAETLDTQTPPLDAQNFAHRSVAFTTRLPQSRRYNTKPMIPQAHSNESVDAWFYGSVSSRACSSTNRSTPHVHTKGKVAGEPRSRPF